MNTLLFDLDGTLLSMDQDVFIKKYFSLLGAKAASAGLNPEKAIKAVWAGTAAMVKNDGSMSNRERFWQTFASILGPEVRGLEPVFDLFYANEFNQVASVTTPTEYPGKIIRLAKEKGYRLLLATNPLFPKVATLSRIRWAGLNAEDFEVITTYEDVCYCKPNPAYYTMLLTEYGLIPEETMMVGNDVAEDIVPTRGLGLHTYLVTDCLIDSTDGAVRAEHSGSLSELLEYIRSLPPVV